MGDSYVTCNVDVMPNQLRNCLGEVQVARRPTWPAPRFFCRYSVENAIKRKMDRLGASPCSSIMVDLTLEFDSPWMTWMMGVFTVGLLADLKSQGIVFKMLFFPSFVDASTVPPPLTIVRFLTV